MWSIVALIAVSTLQGGCCVSGPPFDCPDPEVTVDDSMHIETAPIERELKPLGRVLEVHWFEWTQSGRCDFNIGDLILLREGVARVAPAEVARLTSLTTFDAETLPDPPPDRRLSPWLPGEPKWRSGALLDWRDGEEGAFVTASYWLDSATGIVYFQADADVDPSMSPLSPPPETSPSST